MIVSALEQENRGELADFLDTLRCENRITFRALYDCERDHQDEIKGMESIFHLQTKEDARYCLTLPKLLDPENADALIDYVRSRHRDRFVFHDAAPDVEGCKIPLLAAFVFNPPFFAMAWNWCALYRRELHRKLWLRETAEKSRSANSPVRPRQRVQYDMAASGTGVIRDIGGWLIDADTTLLGRLWINNTAGSIRFLFRFDVYSPAPPCYLVIKCRTNRDGKEYPSIAIREMWLNNPDEGDLIIASSIIPGFDAGEVEIIAVEMEAEERD
jgi:hypothetical protein